MAGNTNIPGKNILITGGTSGLGLELVGLLLKEDINVYTTGRDPRSMQLQNKKVHFIAADFSDLHQVSEAVNNLIEQSIIFDIIINNAGILSPHDYTITKDGFEYTFQVNFLSHLLLDELIIREKSNVDPLTVISVTSPVNKYVKPDFKEPDKNNYRSFKAYAESKLYLLLIGDYLCNKYPGKNLRFIGYDPGTFSSGIYRMQKKWFQNMYRIASPFMRSPEKVAVTLTEIIKEEEIRNGAIYTRRDKYRYLQDIDAEDKSVFLEKCYGLIGTFI